MRCFGSKLARFWHFGFCRDWLEFGSDLARIWLSDWLEIGFFGVSSQIQAKFEPNSSQFRAKSKPVEKPNSTQIRAKLKPNSSQIQAKSKPNSSQPFFSRKFAGVQWPERRGQAGTACKRRPLARWERATSLSHNHGPRSQHKHQCVWHFRFVPTRLSSFCARNLCFPYMYTDARALKDRDLSSCLQTNSSKKIVKRIGGVVCEWKQKRRSFGPFSVHMSPRFTGEGLSFGCVKGHPNFISRGRDPTPCVQCPFFAGKNSR